MAPHRVIIMLILKQKKLHHQKMLTHVLNLMHASSSQSRMTLCVKVESWICGHEKPDYLNKDLEQDPIFLICVGI